MIRSMTAYAICEIKNDWGNIVWEISSLNQRYLEIYFRVPEQFRSLEFIARERVRNRLTRGKVECNLRFNSNINTQKDFIFNENLAKQLIHAANWIKLQSNTVGEIAPVDILRCPGVMTVYQHNINVMTEKILTALDYTLNEFIMAREIEGQAIKKMVEKRLKKVELEINKIRFYIPEVLRWQHNRLINKLKEAEIQPEGNRLEQEMLMIMQRLDVSEELDRLEAHIKMIYNILEKQEAVGRRLDFIMQELNRESNTVASKTINYEITNSAIEIKVLIEQMREQIQNIE